MIAPQAKWCCCIPPGRDLAAATCPWMCPRVQKAGHKTWLSSEQGGCPGSCSPQGPAAPSSTHQHPAGVLGGPVAQLTPQLHVRAARCHRPGQGDAVGLGGHGLDAPQGRGLQLGCRERWGELGASEGLCRGRILVWGCYQRLEPQRGWVLSSGLGGRGGASPKCFGQDFARRGRSWRAMRCKQPAAHGESLGKFIFFFRNQKICSWPRGGQGLPRFHRLCPPHTGTWG